MPALFHSVNGYCVTVSTPGLHRVCTLDTGVKGRKSENMADYMAEKEKEPGHFSIASSFINSDSDSF